VTRRGVEGPAELVVEVRSPGDETYDKLPFYERKGVRQVLVVARDALAVQLFEGAQLVAPGPVGFLLTALGLSVQTRPRWGRPSWSAAG